MQVHINEICDISKVHVSLDLSFLKKLCRTASNSANPARNKKFAEELGAKWNDKVCRCTSMDGWLNGHCTITLFKLAKLVNLSNCAWSEIEDNIIKLKAGQHKGEIQSNFPISFDHRLGSIVGHIMGDGSISLRFSQVFFSNKNPELLNEFMKYMNEIFGVKPRIWEHATNNYGKTKWNRRLISLQEKNPEMCVGLFYPSICGMILHGILGIFASGRKKVITSEIREMPAEFKKGFLRALFDDEGSCDAKSYMIRMHQDDEKLLEDAITMLQEFGIKSNPVRAYWKNGKTRHYFNITRKENFAAFNKHVGFTSSKKQNALNQLIT